MYGIQIAIVDAEDTSTSYSGYRSSLRSSQLDSAWTYNDICTGIVCTVIPTARAMTVTAGDVVFVVELGDSMNSAANDTVNALIGTLYIL